MISRGEEAPRLVVVGQIAGAGRAELESPAPGDARRETP